MKKDMQGAGASASEPIDNNAPEKAQAASEAFDEEAAYREQQARYRAIIEKGLSVMLKGPENYPSSYTAYRIGPDGFWHLYPCKLKDGGHFTKEVRISPGAIVPIEMIESVGSGTEREFFIRVVFKYLLSDSYAEATIPLSSITSPTTKDEYIRRLKNAGVGDHEIKKLNWGKHMQEMLLHASDLVPVVSGKDSAGWHNDLHLRPGKPGYVGSAQVVTGTKGNPDIWRETAREMITESPLTGFVVAAAFGSLVRGRVTHVDTSSLIHIDGIAGLGKTLATQLAASIQGYPDRGKDGCFFPASTTAAAFERVGPACNHGHIVLDETHSLLRKLNNNAADFTTLMVDMLNGGGRGTAAKGGMEAVNTHRVWNLTLLTSGNMSVLELARGHDQESAIQDRTVEIDTAKYPVFPWRDSVRADGYLNVLKENYGHGYEAAVKYIVANTEFLQDLYHASHRTYSERLPNLARRSKSFALALVGTEIMAHVIGLTAKTKERIHDFMDVLFADSEQTVSRAKSESLDDQLSELNGLANQYLSRLKVDKYLWKVGESRVFGNAVTALTGEHQMSAASLHNSEMRSVTVLGMIKQDVEMKEAGHFSGLLMLNTKEALKLKRDGIDVQDMARKALAAGFLHVTKGEQIRYKTREHGWVYCFDIGKAQQLINAAITEEADAMTDYGPESQGYSSDVHSSWDDESAFTAAAEDK